MAESTTLPAELVPARNAFAGWRERVAGYAFTITISAFLLFQVQPVIAKMILPWFGGSAGVWTTCMLFFQIVLLLGYFYAHLSIRYLTPGRQAFLHVGLLLASLLLIPVIPNPIWKPVGTEEPAFRILGVLATTIGLPYFLLSSTSPLLQAWYSRTRGNAIPYRLFALSNAGSMLALLSYPVLIEPAFTTRHQALGWSGAYIVFVALCSALALGARKSVLLAQAAGLDEAAAKPAWSVQMLWLALSACGSALLLAVTNHLTQNVASIPFLWILPLALYLLSFILCFEGRSWYRRYVFLPLVVVTGGGIAYTLADSRELDLQLVVILPLYAAGLFAWCMTCHGELARLKPHPRHLTSFYLMSSLGGAIGGVLVGLVAPFTLRDYYELPIVLACGAFLIPLVLWLDNSFKVLRRPLVMLGCVALMVGFTGYLGYKMRGSKAGVRVQVRDFYGSLHVVDFRGGPGKPIVRELRHGNIDHGEQVFDPLHKTQPTTYYGRATGVGLGLQETMQNRSLRVGVIGLGAGTLAAYGRSTDTYRFYEISPKVVGIAQTEFTFLRDTRARIEIALGDARLSLEREPAQNFDFLALDAFSGDAIPVHLLTREAFALYFRHLKKDGILAVHVTNAYLDLAPVVRLEAEALGKTARAITNEDDDPNHVLSSTWVLVADSAGWFDRPSLRAAAKVIRPRKKLRIWTDDYSNLLRVLGDSGGQ